MIKRINIEHTCSSGMMHPQTQFINIVIFSKWTKSALICGMNEVDIKLLDSSDINNSLSKELLNAS